MLSERQLQNLLKVFDGRMQAVTENYIRRMGEHIREIGKLTETDVHRLTQMKRMNANIDAIRRELAAAADASMADIEAVFRAAAESDVRFAEAVFADDHTPAIKASPANSLSTPLERILKAQLRVTAQEMANLSQTTLVSEAYRNAVDVAVQTVQSGVTDYTSAIRSALKEAAKEGLRVQYPSGLTRRLDTAIRQNVLDGVRALNQDVLNQMGKDFRADGVEISAHALCATDHLPYQGVQMSKKEFDRLQNLLSRPFGLWNCKHTVFPIILGISPPAHTPEELEAYRRNSMEAITIDGVTKSRYEWTQVQRRIETAIREQKYIANAAKAADDPVARRQAQAAINRLDEEYAKISGAAGLYEEPQRMRVAGFRKVKTTDELKNQPNYAKITPSVQSGGGGVRTICKLDRSIYSCISKDIVTDEVVLIDERILHIKDHHPNDYERFGKYIVEMIERPDYIIEANRDKSKSGLILKEFTENNEQFRLVLRLATSTDKQGLRNSVITFQYVKKKEYDRLIRNKKVLYRRIKT